MPLKLINNALQKYLDSDPEIASKLDQFEGNDLLVHLNDINKEFVVTLGSSSMVVSEHVLNEGEEMTQEFATTIHSNIISLVRIGLGADYQTMLNNGSLTIEGDVELANQLRAIFKEIDIDWEEVASKYVGDSVAYQVGLFANRFKNYSSRSVNNFRLDVSEYLQEESRVLPTKVEVDRFMNDVDNLDANVQRLEARVQRLIEASKQ
ncbi:MAG: SCP2 sterol-binding domain-containing protein [Pseudomonadota bacterium]